MIAFFIDVTRISQYLAGGTRLSTHLLYLLALLVPLSFFGAYVAKRIVNKVPQQSFRLVIAALLGLVGLKFLFLP
jgi:uncharacterized membrane protein YfcA